MLVLKPSGIQKSFGFWSDGRHLFIDLIYLFGKNCLENVT